VSAVLWPEKFSPAAVVIWSSGVWCSYFIIRLRSEDFDRAKPRLNYAERLQAGRVIGSGQVEGQAKTLGLGLKRRGVRWNRRKVQPMASLVCVRHTSQWTPYWNQAT
jgi:hypothetical protein